MRKLLAIAASAAVATVAFGASPAQAACPTAGPGTLEPTQKTTPVDAAGKRFYVDDRDFTDQVGENDGHAGGLWLYMESTNNRTLERGGDQMVFVTLRGVPGAPSNVPRVDPIVIPAPGPGPRKLLPEGFGGGSLAQETGEHDDCIQGRTVMDTMIF